MSRPLRLQEPGDVFHVTQHGIGDAPIFRSDVDRERFLLYLSDEVGRSEWTCLAYTLMRTHYHVLLRLTKPTLSSGFQRLNSRYAMYFNRTYGRRGVFFERRFRDVLVEGEIHRCEALRYIHLNAPRANSCVRPEQHVWCDYASTVGLVEPDGIVDPRAALELFGANLKEARRSYIAFVEEQDRRVRRGLARVRAGSDPEK